MSEQKVVICKDLKSELQDFLSSLKYDKLFILMDTNTKEKCFPLVEDIPAFQKAPILVMEAGDMNKGFVSLAQIWTALSNEGASRNSLLVNLGGGMITDMGGFAGATFKRGIRTINIPTTLMASVDAAVGGKTGINFNGLKNEVGSFYPPLCVFIDCDFLRTLDRDNILSGYAEMIKHGLISSMENYASVMLFDIDTMNYSYLNSLVGQSVAVKERIVEEDPKEQGIRKALNFGHTIGHAFESLSFLKMRPILHGHAVAAGYRVAVFYHTNAEAAAALQKELPGVLAVQCDVASRASCELAFRAAEQALGRVDVLVSNAGIAQQKLFTTSVFGWRHLVALIDIVAVVLFALAVRGVVIDVRLRKAAKTEKKNS